jgi:hypothetical protein
MFKIICECGESDPKKIDIWKSIDGVEIECFSCQHTVEIEKDDEYNCIQKKVF